MVFGLGWTGQRGGLPAGDAGTPETPGQRPPVYYLPSEHSRKPEEAREKIVALMGDVPRVELFARQTPPG